MRVAIAILFACVAAGACAPEPGGFSWKCQPTTRNSMQCVIKNTSANRGEICMQVAKVCKGGDHLANLCSESMNPGEVTTKVIPSFEPKVKLLETCMGVEFRDKKIIRQ